MKITTVSLSRTIPTGSFQNEKIGFEATLEPGESCAEALNQLNHLITQWHREANPHLYQEPASAVSVRDANYIPPPSTQITIPIGEPLVINLRDEKLSIAMENAKSVEELKAIKEANPVMKFPLMKAYNKRLFELTTQSPHSPPDVQ